MTIEHIEAIYNELFSDLSNEEKDKIEKEMLPELQYKTPTSLLQIKFVASSSSNT